MELQIVWFLLIGVVLTVYVVLDGFDLGVGIWHLFARRDDERRTLLTSVGPVWDGNEVWLLTGGGALFAAFPPVYAAVFSGLYLPMMVVLFALIARAVSFEFRGKEDARGWRAGWDLAFALGSMIPALLLGVVAGNLLRGLPLDLRGDYAGGFLELLHPFALVVGGLGFALFAQQGAVWVWMKTEGELTDQARGWAFLSWGAAALLFVAATIWVLAGLPHVRENFLALPVLWGLPVAALVLLVLTGWAVLADHPGRGFLFSSLTIVSLMATFGASVFPSFVRASNDPRLSLTAYNSSSSDLTLEVMLVIAGVGVPLVAGYTIWVYRKFRGKVRVGHY
ncbi:MAG: cytochrome d ubiquinol oxidase subunit II [Deltaproteobacteria bacterium]|nr:cytochrome d ubiquinol oxidase subunit II [Deltaproteobacteria bacterium]